MVDISSQNNKINVTVSSSGNTANTNVTPDYAQYYSEKSKEWAISNRIVDNTDYSSKYYANESKKQADISTAKATEVIESGNTAVSNIDSARDNAIIDVNTAGATQVALATEQANIATNKASEVVENGNTALSNIDTAKDNAITSITNQETTSKTVLIDEGATQIGLIQNEGATQVANVQSTGFYMRDDKLYYINSQGEETEFKSGGSGLEVCDIGMALYIDETKGLRRYLNGQIVEINSNTQAFLNRLLQIQTTNPEYFTTEDNWQAEALLNIDGCVYKFVLNYASDGETVVSVRLPKYPDYVEINAGGTLPVVGNGMAIGLTTGSVNAGLDGNNSSLGASIGQYGKPVATTGRTHGDLVGAVGLTTDPKKSGLKATLNQTKLKLRYFIQIATGQETEVNIRNDIESLNPYTLFDAKYSEAKQYNASWVLGGSTLSKSVYPTAYEAALVEYNSEVADGTTVELPSGGSYTKRGVSGGITVKLSTDETVTEYDWKLDTVAETLTVPTLNGSEDLLSDRYDDLELKASGSTYTAPANGWFWIQKLSSSTGQFLTPVIKDSNGNIKYTLTSQPTGVGYDAEILAPVSKGDVISIGYSVGGATKSFRFIYAKGNGSLYFLVASVAQNAPLANLGRIEETKVDKNSSWGFPSNRYIDLTLGASGSTYTAPANGWVYLDKTAGKTPSYISLHCNSTFALASYSNYQTNKLSSFLPVKKGDVFRVTYDTTGAVNYFKFIYAEGSN